MIAGVEHIVRHARHRLAVALPAMLRQELGKQLGFLDRHRAHQDGLTAAVAVDDLFDDRLVLLFRGPIDLVVLVLAHHRPVGRDLRHIHLVDVEEFLRLGGRRPGHAGELVVEAEVVLDGDRGQGLVLGLDVDPVLGLDRLVQAFRQPPAVHHPPGEFVDQHDLAVAHDVVAIALIEHVGAQGLVDVVHHRDVGRVVESGRAVGQVAGRFQHLLDGLRSGLGEQGLLLLLVVLEGCGILDQLLHQQIHGPVEVRAVLGGSGDDQRRARLVDQDRVDLVDDPEVMAALDHLAGVIDQVVAQIVEAEFVVGAVGDVGGVGALALALREAIDDHPDVEAEETIDPAHPFGVARGQIVVDGDQVHALAGDGVEIGRQGGDQGLALARAHLGDSAFVQHHAADHLHVVMPLAQAPHRRLADHREGLVHHRFQGLPLGVAGPEFVGLGAQRVVGEGRDLRLQGVDRRHLAQHRADLAVVGRAEDFFQVEHERSG